MLQQRQIIKAFVWQVNTEYLRRIKYAITDFHSIVWVFISVNVTIYRTIALSESYENSHYIMTTKLRSCS
jgi:hypothetical protein